MEFGKVHGIRRAMQLREIAWPGVATLVWDGDELLDVTNGQRAHADGPPALSRFNMTYQFDRAISLRSGATHWAVAYTNRNTKALLMKNGTIDRELNRSFYCANDYDYPISIGPAASGGVLVAHCPHAFNLLEIEDAETGATLDSLESEAMEFHSRLSFSPDGRFLSDAGWFWHPLSGAAVFQTVSGDGGSLQFDRNPVFRTEFSETHELDSMAFLGNTELTVSFVADHEGMKRGPGQLCIWSLTHGRWKSRVEVNEPIGMMMPWKELSSAFTTIRS
ncbi:MAG: hypothetical protein WA369_17320 [Candidatus Acidiferrales bacterium]